MFINRKAAAQGFALGFTAVCGPVLLRIHAVGHSGEAEAWMAALAIAAIGGAAGASLSLRRAPKGARRGLLLGAFAWAAVLSVGIALLRGGMYYVLFFLPFLLGVGCLVGTVGGMLLGPPPPDAGREAQSRFTFTQNYRRRRALQAREKTHGS